MFEILPQPASSTLLVSLLLLFYFYFGKKKVNLKNNSKMSYDNKYEAPTLKETKW
jgi:hypothetical protein